MVDTALSSDEQRRQLEITYDWLPSGAIDVYLEEWFKSGNADTAWAVVQQDPRYEDWFPGNLTEDGRPRMPEADYAKTIATYDEVFVNVGLNPKMFRGRYGELIRGEVSPYELETTRINPMHDRIVTQSQELKQWYATNFGIRLTDAALLGSVIDPDLGEKILTKQIDMAEIGGEALESGFNIDSEFARRIVEESQLDRAGAERMFQNAESFVPVLNVLASRHADSEDDFDLNEFVAADLFKDPVQIRRMTRLIAQERSTFTGGTEGYRRSRTTGGVGGLSQP